ncbi:MAG: DUF3347 domain-containing protein [Ignavibacteria bacterium]|jgi:hypothetical protein|nr:DUF3347 domain-containing protein [Ignavibacteria bacterium]
MNKINKSQSIMFLISMFCLIIIGNQSVLSQTNVTSQKSYTQIEFDNSELGTYNDRVHVTDVMVDYMLLKNTLAKGRIEDARRVTKMIINVIDDYWKSMNPEYLPDQKKFSNEMKKLKAKVNPSTTLDEARKIFSAFTDLFMIYVKSYGLNDKTVYLLNCVNNSAYGNGYWLTDVKNDKRNPYLGKNADAECYKVKESWIYK